MSYGGRQKKLVLVVGTQFTVGGGAFTVGGAVFEVGGAGSVVSQCLFNGTAIKKIIFFCGLPMRYARN